MFRDKTGYLIVEPAHMVRTFPSSQFGQQPTCVVNFANFSGFHNFVFVRLLKHC